MKTTISVECPHCGESFVVVEPESEQQNNDSEQKAEQPIEAELTDWVELSVTDPYSASEDDIPVSQRVKADIRIGGEEYSFTFWYTPEYKGFDYVVRGQLDSGLKSKDIHSNDEGELFLVNRGIPRNSDKQWTYLDAEECRRRSNLAGLGEITNDPYHKGKDHRLRIFLNEHRKPLIENEEIAEDLLLKLAKGLVAYQTKR